MNGSVKKYGSTWRIRWEAGTKPNGRRDQRSKGGFASKKAAQAALHEQLELVNQGLTLDVSKLTVGDYLVTWLESKHNVRDSTRRSYEGHIRVYLVPHIGDVPLRSLRADHLDRMYAAIRAGTLRKAPGTATIRRVHATLRTALGNAYRRRLIAFNPAGQVELDPEPTRQRGVWTPEELATFLAHSRDDRLGAAYRLIALTGVRRGECCGLCWGDLDLEGGTATIRQQLTESGGKLAFGEPKTRRGARNISLDAETVTALKAHKVAQAAERLKWGPAYRAENDLVFRQEHGAPLHPDHVSRRFLALSRAAGLPRIVLHGLRHTHATHALAAGVDITVVSNRLGHSRSSFTADTYTRVLPAVDREAADRIADVVRQAGTATTTRQQP